MASIKKRPDGKWRARYRDTSGKEHASHHARKLDAQRWLDEQTASLVTGSYVDPRAGRITFARFYTDWSDRQVWAPGTRRAMDLAAGSVTFGDVPLRSLRRSHVETWVKGMQTGSGSGRPLAPGTIHTRVQNVRAVLRGAVADQVIGRDPGAGIALPRRRKREAAMAIPTPEQVGQLLIAADDDAHDGFRVFVALCAFAGLRLGEAAAVQVGDIDFMRRRLTVSRQVQRENGGVLDIRPPKFGSERVVHLPDDLAIMLSAHIAARVVGSERSRWLFTGRSAGQPPHQNTIGHRWRQTMKAAGLSSVKLHDLRHFYASGLIAAGCDVVTVQRALGHASANTTLSTYSHLWPTAEDRTRAAASGMLTEALAAADSADSRATFADSVRTGAG